MNTRVEDFYSYNRLMIYLGVASWERVESGVRVGDVAARVAGVRSGGDAARQASTEEISY